ncbi:MAG: 3-oxoacyl-ACP synthase, partial [Caldilineaceae bacterium]|nr:3-oxoacyl-ACP synthase [Caldilineaceae bacterium]
MLPVKIAGLGCYLPQRRVTNRELEERLSLQPGWIERRTGIHERRYVTDESTVGMAAIAIERALAQAGHTVADIDLIIGASTGPQQAIPCTAALVQRALGAPDGGSVCFDLNATCLTFLFAL